MEFLRKIGNSIYDPAYYQELLEKPFSYSVKYFAGFFAIFALLLIVGFSLFYFPRIEVALNDGVRMVVDSYPEELVVTMKNGALSTNAQEPYFVKFPATMDENKSQADTFKNLITIDTKSEASVDNLSKYETMVLVTKNYIIYQKDNGQIVTQPLENISDVVIDKAFVNQFVEKYSPWLKLLFPFFVIGLFIFVIFLLIFRLCYLFLAALLIWLVAYIKKVEISYGKSYQLGLHLMTLPLIIISPFTFINFPFAFSLLLLILAFVNIKKKEPVIVAAQPETIQEAEVKEV